MSRVEANTESIIRLVWARALGLPDDALATPGSRIVAPAAEHGADAQLRVLTLFDSAAMVGPEWMLERVQADPSGEVRIAQTLSALGPGAREVSREVLAYRDQHAPADLLDLPGPDGGHGADGAESESGPLVSHDPADLAALLASCPADDVLDAELHGLELAFTMLDDDHRPLAAAAYRVEHGLVADVRALTDPTVRGQGHAALLAGLLADDAWDSGLIAQSRHRPSSLAGARLAAALGFTPAGSLTILSSNGPAGAGA